MPKEILELQERAARADAAAHQEAIRSRLAAHLPLYTLSRYRPPRLAPVAETPTGVAPTAETPTGDDPSARVDASRSPSQAPRRFEDAIDDGQDDLAVADLEPPEAAVDLPEGRSKVDPVAPVEN
jgi:hypothetical protein